MKNYALPIVILIITSTLSAQNVRIANSAGTADASAMVDIVSTTKGLLIPRMSTTDRDGISSPARGLMIYNTTDNTFQFHDGSAWQSMGNSSGGSSVTNLGDLGDVLVNANYTSSIEGNHESSIYISRFLPSSALGVRNTAVGARSLLYNTTGTSNSGFGYASLGSNTTGEGNTAVGNTSLFHNTTGINNTAIGFRSLRENVDGSDNVAVGKAASLYNVSGSLNVAIGTQALYFNQNGQKNVAVGPGALVNHTNSNFNTALGPYAMQSSTTGTNNTAVGALAALNMEGDNSTAIGANTVIGTYSNATAIGYQATATASNSIQLGNASITAVNTAGQLTTGAVTYPNTDGTSGQVLTTDGAGNATWSTPQSGGSNRATIMHGPTFTVDPNVSLYIVTGQATLPTPSNALVGIPFTIVADGIVNIVSNTTNIYGAGTRLTGSGWITSHNPSIPVNSVGFGQGSVTMMLTPDLTWRIISNYMR